MPCHERSRSSLNRSRRIPLPVSQRPPLARPGGPRRGPLFVCASNMSGQQCNHNLSEEDAIVHTGTADAQELGIETLQVWQVQQVRADQCAEGAGDVSDDLCSARSEYFS